MGKPIAIVLSLSFIVCASFDAHAQNDPQAVVLIADKKHEQRFESAILAAKGQLFDLPVSFHTNWVSQLGPDLPAQEEFAQLVGKDSNALAVFWCVFRGDEQAYLYLSVPHSGRIIVRHLEGSGAGGLNEVLAVVIRASVDSLLTGGDGEPETKEPEVKEPEIKKPKIKEPEVKEPKDWSIGVDLAYRFETRSKNHIADHGLLLALDLNLTPQWSVLGGYTFFFLPVEGSAGGVSLRLYRHPMFVGSRYSYSKGRWKFGASIMFGLDYVTEKLKTPENIVPLKTNNEFEFLMTALLCAGVSPIKEVDLYIAAGADFVFNTMGYTVQLADEKTTLVDSWPARPVVIAGVSVRLF